MVELYLKDGSGIEDLFTWIAKTVSSSADDVSVTSFEPDDRVELRQGSGGRFLRVAQPFVKIELRVLV